MGSLIKTTRPAHSTSHSRVGGSIGRCIGRSVDVNYLTDPVGQLLKAMGRRRPRIDSHSFCMPPPGLHPARRVQACADPRCGQGAGVAKGTVYLYVESKEALFDLCIRAAGWRSRALPVPTPPPTDGELRSLIHRRRGSVPPWAGSRGGRTGGCGVGRATAVVDEIYGTLSRYRTMIRLIEASAQDLPELGGCGTPGPVSLVGRDQYLETRMAAGDLRTLPDARVKRACSRSNLLVCRSADPTTPSPRT